MADKLNKLLIVSQNATRLLNALPPDQYHCEHIDDAGEAMETLSHTKCDLIILDKTMFEKDLNDLVREMRRRNPIVPVLILSDDMSTMTRIELMEAGADDLLPLTFTKEELLQAVVLRLKQRQRSREAAQRNRNLYEITLLTRRLHGNTEPQTLIVEAIDLVCSTFKLYGMAIVLGEDDTLHIYAGQENVIKNANLYQSKVQTQPYEPFHRVISSGVVEIFENIAADTHYIPLPILPQARSAIIVPLTYQDYTLGALGVFGTVENPLLYDDLVIYEILAAQFVVALQNSYYNYNQHLNVQFSRTLLKAWQRFISLDSQEAIAAALCEMVADLASVKHALVWYGNENTVDSIYALTSAQGSNATQIFTDLYMNRQLDEYLEKMDNSPQVLFQLGRTARDPLLPLFRSLGGQQLVILPITDSARLVGGVIASVTSNKQFSIEDANLVKSLTHAAGQALERMTLIIDTVEKSARLEAILRSISEGVFMVDDGGRVAFCNPQFTELTGINPSEVLDHEPTVLLDRLSAQATDEVTIRQQLYDAMNDLQTIGSGSRNYPIVDLTLVQPESAIHVEFVSIEGVTTQGKSWVGVVRNSARLKTRTQDATLPMTQITRSLRTNYAQIGAMLNQLGTSDALPLQERNTLANQIRRRIGSAEEFWDDFVELYNVEVAKPTLNYDDLNLVSVVQRVLEKRFADSLRTRIELKASSNLPLIKADEIRVEQILINLVQTALHLTPRDGIVRLSLEAHDYEVYLIVEDEGPTLPKSDLVRYFEPFYAIGDDNTGLGLYLTRKLVQKHNGRIWVENNASGRGKAVTVLLPAIAMIEPVTSERAVQTNAPVPADRGGRGRSRSGAPRRAPQTIMIVEGSSALMGALREQLEAQGYEVMVYRSGEEAVRDVNLTRLDLIALDEILSDGHGLDLIERLRKQSEVPIIMVADRATEAKVRALKLGADDYLTKPISSEEMLARVNVIFNRQHISDRTREPLDLEDLTIDFARREVFVKSKLVELTRIEYDLLHTLVINMGQVLTHKQLLEKVWGPEYRSETQYLWVNISRLRKKLEPTQYIHNQQGIGYVFQVT